MLLSFFIAGHVSAATYKITFPNTDIMGPIWSPWVNVNACYNYTSWSPIISNQTSKFNQTRSCSQDQTRTLTDTTLGTKKTENQTISVPESRIINVSSSGWQNSGSVTNCTAWSPAPSTVYEGSSVQQSRTCDQLQTNTFNYSYNSSVIKTNSQSQTITVNQTQQVAGTKPVDCSNVSGLNLANAVNYSYNGSNGNNGSIQTINIPSNTVCIIAYVYGSDGNSLSSYSGGKADLIIGNIDIIHSGYSTLHLLVAGYPVGGGSGGGLSGVFTGVPSGSNSLIIAGGGGGAGTGSNGYDASLTSPIQPSAVGPYSRGIGFGANGKDSSGSLISSPQAFSNGGVCINGSYSGAYGGGGANCGLGLGGGGGAPGGEGSAYNSSTGNYDPGGGGTSYCSSNGYVTCQEHTVGGNGLIRLEYYTE